MNIGIPKERRSFEFRVGLSPAGVEVLCQSKNVCFVEHEAGVGAGFSDQEYERAGARIVYSPEEVFGRADLLLKVARPIKEELDWLRSGVTIAGLLHLASTRQDKIELLEQKQITAIAYEQIRLPDGSMPVRAPLSQIGGHLAAQMGARLLQNDSGGKGILLGGIPGVPPAEVVVIGAGLSGTCAVQAFVGMRSHVTVLDSDLNALQRICERFPGVVTMVSNHRNIARVCAYADIVATAILVSGERSPIIITREMVRSMKPRSVIMDLSIDEGGCVETSRPTTHEKPSYVEEGIIHYCVPNIPSVVARTSTYAFMNAAFPFIMEIADKGVDRARNDNSAIANGTVVYRGQLQSISRFKPKP
jgi:alanine dehydrogenase